GLGNHRSNIARTSSRLLHPNGLDLIYCRSIDAGWSSPVARWAHNPKVAGSNPAPATKFEIAVSDLRCLSGGRSSVGRAPRLQRGGQGFESPRLHQSLRSAKLERLRFSSSAEVSTLGRKKYLVFEN